MAFRNLEGKREFLWAQDGTNYGWGSCIIRVPNYSAAMQRWRGRLTQTRDTVTFADADQKIIDALGASSKVLDHTFSLCGRLEGESYATLFTGVCKSYEWNAGVTQMSIANRFEELRSGRFQSNYRYLDYYDMSPLRVSALNGTEVVLNGALQIDAGGAVAYDHAQDTIVFLATNSILVFDPGDDPSSVSDPWEFTVAGFPHGAAGTATSIAMRIDVETAVGQNDYVYTSEDKLFVGIPQALIREFLSGTCTDVGWAEGTDFVIGTTSVLDQVELRVPINYRANTDVSVLSVLDHICETTLISAWPDREAVVHFVPHTQADLSTPSDGTLSRETGFKSLLRYSYDSENIVTIVELYYGYNSDADSVLDEWGGHKRFKVPPHWPGQLAIGRTRSMRARYLFDPDAARAMAVRILSRHYKGVPQLEFDCLPTAATITIGAIETITYSLLDVNNAYYEVTSIRDDWERDSIRVTSQAATAIYAQSGFGVWEDSSWGVDHAVTATSTFGFCDGTLGAAVGTCNGINESLYGSTWRWAG